MKRNRRQKKFSNFRTGSMGIVMLILTGFIMLMVYWSLDSRCTSISREIGDAERTFKKLQAEHVQESARWETLKTPENLARTLTRFGLEMRYPRVDQIVRVDADGRLGAAQSSVRVRRQSSPSETLAMKSSNPAAKERLRTTAFAPARARVVTARR